MSDYLLISATFLDSRFHGRGDGGEPEWPPSPLRLMQAIIAANTDKIGRDSDLDRALTWLEDREPPMIVAPPSRQSEPYRLSVPNNAMDIVGRAWSKGNYFGRHDTSPATHRTMKTFRPIHLLGDDTVSYLWSLGNSNETPMVEPLINAAKRINTLGWGIDLVMGNAGVVSASRLQELWGERWLPATSKHISALRTPVPGTLTALREHHQAFLHRIGDDGFVPVPPLTRFDVTGYRRPSDPITRPHAIFELRHSNGSFCAYPQRKLIHIAGMVRHLAIEMMSQSPPSSIDDDWIERYVAGHRSNNGAEHRQLSYVPLPSLGHERVDQSVRRVMITAPVGDDEWLEHLARLLTGRQLRPENGHEFRDQGPPTLERVYRDNVAERYSKAANQWASVTPIILPGHSDGKPAKAKKLIEAALVQSDIEQSCSYEWSTISHFRNSLTAHKYDKDKRENFFLPSYLQRWSAVHLTLAFDDDVKISGPLVLGAGRHCGFGLMAGVDGNVRQ